MRWAKREVIQPSRQHIRLETVTLGQADCIRAARGSLVHCGEVTIRERKGFIVQLGQALGQAGHIAQRELRLVAAGQSGIPPAHKVSLIAIARVGGPEINHQVSAVLRRGELDAEILRRLRDALRIHPRGRPALAANVTDRVKPPQCLLPLVDCLDQRLGLREPGFVPQRPNAVEHQRPAGGGVLIEHVPERLEIFCVQPVLGGDCGHAFFPLPKRPTLRQRGGKVGLERDAAVAADDIGLGRGGVIPRVAKLSVDVHVTRIKLVDARHDLVGPVAFGRVFGKTDAVREQHHVPGDLLAGVEELIDQRGRHSQRIAGVGEALTRRAVDRKLTRGIQRRHPGEVAHGVVVLVVIEAAQHHATGVAGQRPSLLDQKTFHPLLQGRALLVGGLIGFPGRHLSAREHLLHLDPGFRIAPEIGKRLERIEIHLRLGILPLVAVETKLIQQWPDFLRIILR